jgi:hypothetical protein
MGNPMAHVPLIPALLTTGFLSAGVFVTVNFRISPSPSLPVTAASIATKQFGLNEYTMLQPGMTLTEVRSILGKGTELKSTANSATYEWKNADGSRIHCSFKQGKLELKEQSKLG